MLKKPRFWIGTLSTAVFLFFLLRTIDFSEFSAAIKQANYWYLIPAVVVYFVAVAFRSARWHYLLMPLGNVPIHRLYSSVVIGFMVNNLLPVRLGELFRAYLIGDNEKISKSGAFATIAMERLLDAIVLAAVAFFISLFVSVPPWLETTIMLMAISMAICLAGLGLMMVSETTAAALLRMLFRPLPLKLREKIYVLIGEFLIGLRSIKNPSHIARALLFSILTWATESSIFYIMALAFGFSFDNQMVIGILLAVAAANLLTAVPSSAGGVGPFEFATRETIVHFGISHAAATAFAVVVHAVLIIPVVVAGLYFLWTRNISFRSISKHMGIGEPVPVSGEPPKN
ncbi:MAG: flippase-like domain-containing protein [Dehalococcoidia bacterium]|nr:flippase-like domain-containing protein [Dehalococcoidia bacterium]